jgi:hypothetical protein
MSDPALEAHEHAEHAEHAAHENDPFVSRVSITIALLAVIATITGSLETLEDGSAIISAQEAVLSQDKATDKWSFFEAKSLKKNIYSVAADQGGPKAADYAKKAKAEGADQDAIGKEAKALEDEREASIKVSQSHERRHHRLALGATLLEMGIAISTIAIITRKRWPWTISGVLGVAGVAVAIWAYLPVIMGMIAK